MARVLLVEDDALVAEMAGDALEEIGFHCLATANVKQTLALVDFEQFDFALVDVGLPDGRGDELAFELRLRRPDFPIIIASGYGPGDINGQLQAMSQVVVLAKPYDAAQLQQAVDAILPRS